MTIENRPPSFGRTLLAARLEKGLSIKDVSRTTRIGVDTIFLIENEETQRLPAPVFVKGFIRAYAKTVDVDGDTVVSLYTKSLKEIEETQALTVDVERANAGFWWRICVSFGILLAAAVAMFYVDKFFLAHSLTDEKPAISDAEIVQKDMPHIPLAKPEFESAPAPSLSVTAPERQPEGHVDAADHLPETGATKESGQIESHIKPEAGEIAPPVENSGEDGETAGIQPEQLLLQIHAVEATWLKIIVDVESPVEYSLKPGDKLELDAANGFNLLIGNATGVRLTLNGSDVQVPGKKGQVVNLQLP